MSSLNILVAYPYFKKPVMDAVLSGIGKIRFVLDSGAFTAWKAGKPISLDEYCKFLESLPFEPWRYFTLDVIGEPKKTFENYQTMLRRGFNPIPIFTRGEDLSYLDEYYKTSEVVGLGGLVGTRGNKGFVKGIMSHVDGRKVHWLGFNAKEFISHFKPYMCDSSSFNSSFRYASAKVYDKAGLWMQFTKKDFAKRPNEKLLELIRLHGVKPERLAINDEWSNRNLETESAIETLTHRTWVRYQQDLEKNLGVKFFLACSTPGQVYLMLRAHKYLEEN